MTGYVCLRASPQRLYIEELSRKLLDNIILQKVEVKLKETEIIF